MNEIDFNRALNESAQLLRQNRPAEAEEKLLPLYEAMPDHEDVLINLSGAYILQRKWDKAVKLLNKGAKAHPNNAMLWMNLGAAQLGRLETAGPKQQEQAIEAYQRAIQANPETPNAHYHLGLIYKERGELTRAAAFFQRALEVDPADRDARYWLDQLPLLAKHIEQRAGEAERGKEIAEEIAAEIEEVLEEIIEDVIESDIEVVEADLERESREDNRDNDQDHGQDQERDKDAER